MLIMIKSSMFKLAPAHAAAHGVVDPHVDEGKWTRPTLCEKKLLSIIDINAMVVDKYDKKKIILRDIIGFIQ